MITSPTDSPESVILVGGYNCHFVFGLVVGGGLSLILGIVDPALDC